MGIGEAREVRKETEENGSNELERARNKGKRNDFVWFRQVARMGKVRKEGETLRFELFQPNKTNH